MEKLPILYKYNKNGKPQQWQITIDADSFYTEEGLVGGKITQSVPTVCVGKSIGKKNETTPEQQAIAEATSKHGKKITIGGYSEDLATSGKTYFEPMLAEILEERLPLLFKYRTFIQPKLDGIRAENDNNQLSSRNGKTFVTCPHLHQNDLKLDGELYSHLYYDDFNEISSLIKGDTPTTEELAQTKKIVEMWIYDSPTTEGVFSVRYAALKAHWEKLDAMYTKHEEKNPFVLVPTIEVFTMADIEKAHKDFTDQGFEGSMIRLDSGNYENKRSTQLLKNKDFIDAEFEIIQANEGKGSRAGMIGNFWVRLDKTKPYVISDNKKLRVNCCKTNIKGNHDFLKEVWNNHKDYIGTDATVEFFGYTPAGALRFPYAIKLNRASYE